MKWNYEEAKKVFTDERICGEVINTDKYGFSREFSFTHNDVYYEVVWFNNLSTLKVGKEGQLHVSFFMAKFGNTWPSHTGSKMKLEFRDNNQNLVAVIPVEWY